MGVYVIMMAGPTFAVDLTFGEQIRLSFCLDSDSLQTAQLLQYLGQCS